MTEQNKETQKRMAELLTKEYGLTEEQCSKLEQTDINGQEELAKELAEENKEKLDKEKHDNTNRNLKNLNKHRIVG